MNKKDQISSIKDFISSNESNILVNQVNDEIAIFYLGIIKYFANNLGVKINNNTLSDGVLNEEDLFGTKTIQTYNITNTKKLDNILDAQSKKIVFTDYKNFKRLSSKLNCINGYQFENDIVFFIKIHKIEFITALFFIL